MIGKIAVISLFCTCFAGSLCAQRLPDKMAAVAPISVPALPHSLSFAGESVPLGNYDTRESLVREMLVTSYMHSRTMLTLLNAGRYFSVMEPILERNGIPRDFLYLCMAESGLNPEAVSSARAAGMWQILAATGRELGLTVNNDIDERYDVEKSTEAACKYFLRSYEKFGSWTLTAAAYNVGEAGLRRRMTAQGIDNYYDLFLPSETLRYVFRILSFKLITESPAMYGYVIDPSDEFKRLDDYRIVEVSDSPVDWSAVARRYGTNYKMLRELNRWIRSYTYANKEHRTFTLRIPGTDFRKQ